MRIAFVNWTNRVVGGAEQYVRRSAEFLLEMGHEVSLWYELEGPLERESIMDPGTVSCWCADSLGTGQAVKQLTRWGPDIIYCHGLHDANKEAEIIPVAPSVFFAHSYLGTCVGEKRVTAFPSLRSCERRFGLSCLGLFYPLRCGGLSPVTALSNYQNNVRRLEVLARYSAVITHSDFVARLYRNQGIQCRQIRFISDSASPGGYGTGSWSLGSHWRFLMLARMEKVKGGHILLDALPAVSRALQHPIKLTMAGDGPCRAAWERKAAQILRKDPRIEIEFPGWLSGERLQAVLQQTDLLLMPSLWPEPFGLTGLEAARWGAPCVAFRVGGIPDWLTDGVNGGLAEADPASPASYARAITRILSDEGLYRRLRAGAIQKAQEMTMDVHYDDLIQVFENVTGCRQVVQS
ncbi:MAG: glycosyltransferase family 4 protein [Acidobacteriaceae bacterium]|nr:glycosyltransferase family 4 protein [Acidobacteriaceae bacterium]